MGGVDGHTGMGWVMQQWVGWELQGTESRMPEGIKSDRTIMEQQVIESLNTKIMKILSYWCYRVYNQPIKIIYRVSNLNMNIRVVVWRWVGHESTGRVDRSILSTVCSEVQCGKFNRIIDLSQVRNSVLFSEKLMSTAFCIMWGRNGFVGSCFGRKHFSSIEKQVTFLLSSLGTNVIIMPLRFLYKEHLVIIFNITGNITHVIIKL